MNENTIHGAPKRGREWRIALTNHYAWLQTRGRRENEHERGKCSTEGTVEGGGRRENEHGRGKLILKDTRDQGEAEISGMGLATHTLICIIT